MLLTLERHLNYWQHLQFNVRLPTLITIAETIKFWPMNLHLQMFVHFVFVFVYIVQIYLLVSQNYENGALPILTTKHHLLTTYMPHGHSELVKLQMEKKNIFGPQIWLSPWPFSKLHGRFAFSHNSGHLLPFDEDWNRIVLHYVNTHKRTKSLLIIFLENNFIGIGWVSWPLYY